METVKVKKIRSRGDGEGYGQEDTKPTRWEGLGLRRYGGEEMGKVRVKKIRRRGDGEG